MNRRFLIVVVIYECTLDDSITFQRLLSLKQKTSLFPQILIYDNSLTSQYSGKYLQSIAFYKHNPANGGVAEAYNYALYIGKGEQKEWLVLFDQDTNISNDYFTELEKSIQMYPEQKLFCPIVRSTNKIVSPAYYIAEKAIRLQNAKTGILSCKYYSIINSGLTIQLLEMEKLGGYDRDLPLDFSDHYFFIKYKKRNKHFVVINCENLHSLSADSDEIFEVVYNRFKKFCVSSIIYSNKVHSGLPLVWLSTRAFKLTFKFLRIEFLKFIFVRK